MRSDSRKKKSRLKAVIVAGHIVEVKPDKLLVHCEPDGQERWVEIRNCNCFGPYQKGIECKATIPIDEVRLESGAVPEWVFGRSRKVSSAPSALSQRLKERPDWRKTLTG